MAKSKPDQVIVHRIEFQQHERELLELATASYSVNNVVTPFVRLFTDEGFLIFLTLLLESLGVTDWMDDDLLSAIKNGVIDNLGREGRFWSAAREAARPPDGVTEAVESWKIEGGRLWALATMAANAIKSKVD
jgi:hypothetical protein